MRQHLKHILCFIFLYGSFQLVSSPVSAGTISQTNWSGGTGLSSYSNVTVSTPNQIQLAPNFGTGADGPCTISTGTITLDAASNNTCVSRSFADAYSVSTSANNIAGATSISIPLSVSYPTPTTIDATATNMAMVLGPDGFPRIADMDMTAGSLEFTKCNDISCTSKTTSTLDASATTDNFGGRVAMVLDSANKLHIAYHDDTAKNLKYIQCSDANCTSPTLTTVWAPGTNNTGKWVDIAVDASNNPRIVFHRGSGAQNGGVPWLATFVGSGGTGCTSSAWTCVQLGSQGGLGNGIRIGADGFARIAYNAYDGAAGIDHLRFIRCTNTTCSTKSVSSPVTVDPADSGPTTDVGFNPAMVLGADGFARIVYQDYPNNKVKLAVCLNDDCTSSTITAVVDVRARYPTIQMGLDGFPRILSSTNVGPLYYIICANATCTSKTTKQIDDVGASSIWRTQLAITSDGNAVMAYQDNPNRAMKFQQKSTLVSSTQGFATGDEVLIMDARGTASDNSNVGKYETRYLTGVDSTSLSFTNPLLNSYDGTTQNIVVQRIPQYTNVTIQSPGTLPTSGLLGYWKLDEGTGTTAADSSGNTITGTFTNSPVWTNGKFKSGVSFGHTSNDYIDMGDQASMEITTGTINAWIYRAGPCQIFSNCTIVAKGQSGNVGYALTLADRGSGYKLELDMRDDMQRLAGSTTIATNTWYNVTGTWNGTTLKVYVNGILDGTAVQTVTPTFGSEPFEIGNSNNGQNLGFTGTIDDVRIYNRVLSDPEITTLAKAPEMNISPFSASTGTGGILFFRATGTVDVQNRGFISASGKGFVGGSAALSNGGSGAGGSGGLTYNGTAGNGADNSFLAATSGQGGGGGGAVSNTTVSPGGAGTTGGAGGGGGGDAGPGGGGGGGGGYATTGSGGQTTAPGVNGAAGSGATGGNGGDGAYSGSGYAGGGGGGGTYGDAAITKEYLGSGGGMGGALTNFVAGSGGNGGGLVHIEAATITNSGQIASNGADGGVPTGDRTAGGGGGAGGSIVLKASSLSVGSTITLASGSIGGFLSGGTGNFDGGTGGTGRIALYSPASITGSTSPAAGTSSAFANSPSGTITSNIFDTGSASDWGNLTYAATTPANTTFTLKVRSSNAADMSGAPAFSSCTAVTSGTDVSSNSCMTDGQRYVQYQATMTAIDTSATPTFTSFTLDYGAHIAVIGTPTPSPTPTGVVTSSGSNNHSSAFVPNPNKKDGWKEEIQAGPNHFGDDRWLYDDNIPDVKMFISKNAVHDDVHVFFTHPAWKDLLELNPVIPFPWNQGFSTPDNLYRIRVVSAFNGFGIASSDSPVTIVLPYDPRLLKGRNPKSLKIIYYDTGVRRWRFLSGPNVVDTTKHTVANTTKVFGYFTISYSGAGNTGASGSVQGAKTSVSKSVSKTKVKTPTKSGPTPIPTLAKSNGRNRP